MLSLSLSYLYYIIFLRDKLIYCILASVYTPPVELDRVLKAEIKTILAGGWTNESRSKRH